MTALAAPILLFAPHPGRRARRGTIRQALTTINLTAAIVAAGVIASGWMLAAHPRQPQAQLQCVRWHTCACRYPGEGRWPGNNRLCAVNWGKPRPAGGGRP